MILIYIYEIFKIDLWKERKKERIKTKESKLKSKPLKSKERKN